MDQKLLGIYLNDHLTAATAGAELAKRAHGSNEGAELGEFLGALEHDLADDLAELKTAMARYDVGIDRAKQLAGWTGEKFGRLKISGTYIVGAYFKGEGGEILDEEGFFDTGDVATIDPEGYMQITDRAKDVIKSGGEWISSIEIENIAVGHPKAALAAVIGAAHPKWDERPVLLVKLEPGVESSKEEFLAFLEGKIAKWWTPDEVLFVDDIPLGATGKIDKKAIRAQYARTSRSLSRTLRVMWRRAPRSNAGDGSSSCTIACSRRSASASRSPSRDRLNNRWRPRPSPRSIARTGGLAHCSAPIRRRPCRSCSTQPSSSAT